MESEIPEDAKMRRIRDHNGNICGILFGRYELPWPLIDQIDQHIPTTGYHGVNYYTEPVE
jgi:hypothetical protein